jgi:two-component system response regulator NreC
VGSIERPISVFLADDHVLVREGLKSMLQQAGLDVVGEASDGRAAVSMCEQLRPDVVVLDISMPLLNGIDASRDILRHRPDAKIILLSMYHEDWYVLQALHAGVLGYVLKHNAASTLLQAIESVSRRETYLSPKISHTVVKAYLSNVDAPADPLSARERQVLQLVAEGKSIKAIGDVLGISPRTAETHRIRIAQKLDLHDVAGLTRYAIRHGLVRVDDERAQSDDGFERGQPLPPRSTPRLRVVSDLK